MEQIIYDITIHILNNEEYDAGVLETYLGSYELTDAIITGIKEAVKVYKENQGLTDMFEWDGQ